jgi:hypothetical protein
VIFQSVLSGRRVSNPRNLLLGKQALYQLSYSRVLVILRGILLKLGPTELLGGAAPMAVRASDIALRDLQLNNRPRALTDHPGDGLALQRRIAMIELQNDRIGLTAVNARMGDQIVEYLLTALLPVDLPLSGSALQIRRTIPSVVCA